MIDITGVLHAAHLISLHNHRSPTFTPRPGIIQDLTRVYGVDHDAARRLYRRGRELEARTRPAKPSAQEAMRHREALLAARLISQGLPEDDVLHELASTLGRSKPAARDVLHRGRAIHAAAVPFPPAGLILLIGPGASGKSTFARMLAATTICLDEVRALLTDDPGDQGATPKAVDLHTQIIDERMRRGRTTVADSTNVETKVRRHLLQIARRHRRPVAAVVFTTGLPECAARNAQRPKNLQVPADTLRWQHEQAAQSLPHLQAEGINDIRIVGPLPTASTATTSGTTGGTVRAATQP